LVCNHDAMTIESTVLTGDDSVWESVPGQTEAVRILAASVVSPTHAFLLVGRSGYGARQAARVFAGELLAAANPGTDPERHRHLALTDRHPAVAIIERDGASILVDQAREVVRQAHLSPPEGELQVMVLHDFHLVSEAAPTLLKTIEEPPATTVFIVVADDVPDELVTIASRCVRVEFGPLPIAVVHQALSDEGVRDPQAEAAATACGGDLDRARLLATDPALVERRAFWSGIPDRLDGTGTRVVELVDGAIAKLGEVSGPLEARQIDEMATLEAELTQLGIRGAGRIKELEDRHKREVRRARTDELRAGLVVMAEAYRSKVGQGGAQAFLQATAALRQTEDNLQFNPNERLSLLGLLVAIDAG